MSANGLLKPVCLVTSGKKEQIEYICTKCGSKVRNILAQDDDKEVLLKIIEQYAKNGGK